MPKKNDFKLDVVSVRLVKDAPIYSEHTLVLCQDLVQVKMRNFGPMSRFSTS